MHSFERQLTDRLQRVQEQGLERRVLPLQMLTGAKISHGGRKYMNLASNDYLGLACDRELVAAFYQGLTPENLLDRFGPGSTASRLMTGNHPVNTELEDRLSELYSPCRALIFNSGYHANVGILPALAGKEDLIVADKLCHASLIDGMRLSRATLIRYPHLDYEHLEAILSKKRNRYRQVFIVTESVFSMDGDMADLRQLVELKDAHQAVLYVDEAHSVGLRGLRGRGLAEEQQVLEEIDLLVGTFGKAYGGHGAFVICSQVMCDYLLNTARSFIFTTGLPPISLAWLLFILKRIPGMKQQRRHVQDLSDWLRKALASQGLITGEATNIVPVMIGDADRAVRIAENLREHGFWINAVRPPTVPTGTARLRLSITSAMKQEDLAPLPGLIAKTLS